MREIEIKAKITDFSKLHYRLQQIGCILSEPLTQDDVIFLPAGLFFKSVAINTPVLRVRRQEEAIFFTLKRGKGLDKIEHEILVNNEKELKEIIKELGFQESVRVCKTRQRGKIGEFEICLDTVEELGKFIEIEALVDDEVDGEEIKKKLLDCLLSLGIQSKDIILVGYDVMKYEKNKVATRTPDNT